jgi:hypothetical protein
MHSPVLLLLTYGTLKKASRGYVGLTRGCGGLPGEVEPNQKWLAPISKITITVLWLIRSSSCRTNNTLFFSFQRVLF